MAVFRVQVSRFRFRVFVRFFFGAAGVETTGIWASRDLGLGCWG